MGISVPDVRFERSGARISHGTSFAGRVRHFPSVGSTNSLALEAAQAGAREGVWVADEQTAGRGRGGHAWHSAAGDGLYVSALVRSPDAGVASAVDLACDRAGGASGRSRR